MGQSLTKIYIHLVFSTKNREAYFTREIQEVLFPYLWGILENIGCKPIVVGGERDHIHALFCLGKQIDISTVVRELKTNSSKWFLQKTVRVFNWQNGYGAFSVSPGHVEAVEQYIKNQAEHHRHKTFQEEFLQLLQKYQLNYNPRYIWD